MPRRRTLRAGLLAAFLVLAGGCGSAPDSPATPVTAGASTPPSQATPIDPAVLDDVVVEIRQSRADRGARVVQLRVDNEGTADLVLTGAELVSPLFDGVAATDPAWTRELPAGRHREGSVPLGPARCGPDDVGPPEVAVRLADHEGRVGELRVVPSDPEDRLTAVRTADCAAAAVAAGATITVLGVVEGPDGTAVVELAVEPVPGGPDVVVDRVDGSVLLAPAGSPARAAWEAPFPSDPARPGVVLLPARATRCDPHAVAEDKRGGFFGVHARVDGVPQPLFHVGGTPEVVGAVHEAVARGCGW